jgi:AraC-like DNA-binding protein
MRVSRTGAGIRFFRLHCHPCWEVLYYTKNAGVLRFGTNGEKTIPFREGTVICVPPLLEHGSAGEGVFENICVQELRFPQELGQAGAARSEDGGCIVFRDTGTDLLHLFQMVFRVYAKDPGASGCQIDHLMTCVYDVLIQLCRAPAADPQVERMKNSILEHFTDPAYRISDSLKKFPYSSAHIRNVFREQCGMTPVQYLRQTRLRHAAAVLETTSPSITVAEIAYGSGFSDPLYFSKCFRRTYSLSPQAYREKQTRRALKKTEEDNV